MFSVPVPAGGHWSRARRTLAFVIALALLPQTALAQTEVDLALILAVDASGSVDGKELEIQRAGHVMAITHPAITAAIRHGTHRRIALAYVEWSSHSRQRLVVPLTVIEGPEDAAAFAARIEAERHSRSGMTAIGSALAFAGMLLEDDSIRTDRRVIDISSNGLNNHGARPSEIRDRLVEAGITINGLPMIGGFDGSYDLYLETHFNDCVIGGEGSFALPVMDPADFTVTLIRKMTLEIAGATPPQRARIVPAMGANC